MSNSRKEIIYQIFVRQYSKSHDISAVTNSLERLKAMGITIVYLLPIFPIGAKDRKGSIGSPYSIMDYREIDEDQGGKKALIELIEHAHDLGLKVMLDMVFNHTSKDSVLAKNHPEWFYHKPNGDFANRVGDWSDITDLNYQYPEQTDYLIDTLLIYQDMGIDGFRFDVAPLIPEAFWDKATKKMKEKNPNVILLSESVHLSFTKYLRDLGYEALSDGEMYKWFDMLYEYDVYPYLEEYAKGEAPITKFLDAVLNQESQFPRSYNKIRYLENHDFGRMNTYIKDNIRMLNLLTLNYFLKGSAFLYAGIEALTDKHPNLFEYDEIDWTNYNIDGVVDLITKLNKLKKTDIMALGSWSYEMLNDDVVKITLENKEQIVFAIINLNHSTKPIKLGEIDALDYLNNKKTHLGNKYIPNDKPEIFIINKVS